MKFPHVLRSFARFQPRQLLAGAALAAAVAPAAQAAVTWHDVQFGGFVSQGYLANTGNNDYLGETSQGTFDFREYAVNASYATGAWRVGAQAFGQRLGQYGDDKIKLDWASLDYQPAQWFGIRAGRVKTPRGLYNEALDLDSIRPFVLLPQSVYDARLRDFNAAFNGVLIFGNINLGKAGSLDYRAYYGDIPLSPSSGASDYFNNDVPFPNVDIGMDATFGGSLFWNTPLPGLRVGYSYTEFKNFNADRIVAIMGTPLVLGRMTPDYARHLISVEYITGDWIFAAEAGQDTADYYLANGGVIPAGSAPFQIFQGRYAYVSASRRLTAHIEAGAYYSYSKDVLTGVAAYDYPQGDYAISGKYTVNDHLLFKLEFHYMDGSGKLFDTPTHSQPLAGRDNSWEMIAAKVTYSF